MRSRQAALTIAALTGTGLSVANFAVEFAPPQMVHAYSCYDMGTGIGDSVLDESGGSGNICQDVCNNEYGNYVEDWSYYVDGDCLAAGCTGIGEEVECTQGAVDYLFDYVCSVC